MRTEEEIARFLHAQEARNIERDDMRSIPPFEDWRDQWLAQARELMRFLRGETVEL